MLLIEGGMFEHVELLGVDTDTGKNMSGTQLDIPHIPRIYNAVMNFKCLRYKNTIKIH